ncbi:hypothetical protein Bca52824_037634 [Brassica carinata]|uniref:Uncharacterized protein n=1 Tax=Brassica carinata TaxID=52824 RepID=A0A8X7RQG6_BRACI|nr:hypothetical protein Bca52824_037634 [Brassica carinata]
MESGRCSSKVEVRLLRFWEYRYVRRGGETDHITVDMFLIDWKGTLLPATVNASRVPTFRPHLTAGAIYSIAGFDVALLDVSVTLSMFDSTTVSFHKRLKAMRGDPKDTGLPSAAPLLRGYAKVETLTISERNEFIITALTQDIDFICTGKVTSSKIEKRMMFCCLLRCTKKNCSAPLLIWKEKHSPFRSGSGGDNNNGPAGDDTVVAKVETGGSSEQSASNTGTAPTGNEQKTPPENASLKMVKKALMA